MRMRRILADPIARELLLRLDARIVTPTAGPVPEVDLSGLGDEELIALARSDALDVADLPKLSDRQLQVLMEV